MKVLVDFTQKYHFKMGFEFKMLAVQQEVILKLIMNKNLILEWLSRWVVINLK